jgi:hypothetical protein
MSEPRNFIDIIPHQFCTYPSQVGELMLTHIDSPALNKQALAWNRMDEESSAWMLNSRLNTPLHDSVTVLKKLNQFAQETHFSCVKWISCD